MGNKAIKKVPDNQADWLDYIRQNTIRIQRDMTIKLPSSFKYLPKDAQQVYLAGVRLGMEQHNHRVTEMRNLANASLRMEGAFQRVDAMALVGRGELLKQGLRGAFKELVGAYEVILEALAGEDDLIEYIKYLVSQRIHGIELVLTDKDSGEYLLEIAKRTNTSISLFELLRERLAGGRDPEGHTTLIVETAQKYKGQQYSWIEATIATAQEIEAMPAGELNRDYALSQLRSYGNFWDSSNPDYDVTNLEKAKEYVRTAVRQREKGGG